MESKLEVLIGSEWKEIARGPSKDIHVTKAMLDLPTIGATDSRIIDL